MHDAKTIGTRNVHVCNIIEWHGRQAVWHQSVYAVADRLTSHPIVHYIYQAKGLLYQIAFIRLFIFGYLDLLFI